MQMTGHKTRSVFERYNIVSECDLVEAAKKLNAFQPASSVSTGADVGRPKDLRYEDTSPTVNSDREGGLPAIAAKSARRDGGHNLGTIGPDRGSRLRVSL